MENQQITAPASGAWHQEACEMRLNGATYRDIAKHFGVSVPAAYFAVNPHKRLKGKPKKKTTGLSEVSLNVNPGA